MRGIALVGVSVLLAIAATLVAARWLESASRKVAAPAAPTPMAAVLVAARDLAPGEPLRESDVAPARFPADQVTAAFLTPGDPRLAAGATALVAIRAGTPVVEGFLTPAAGPLVARLAPGKRAMAIPVSASSAVAGLIAPGDHVDLVVTRSLPSGRTVAATLVTDVKVLGLDQRTAPVSGDEDRLVPATVTLEVTPRQAEDLALVETMGRVTLALRGRDPAGEAPSGLRKDTDVPRLSAFLLAESVAAAQEPPLAAQDPRARSPVGPAQVPVQVVRGSSQRTATPAAAPEEALP
ncbi:MAG: Flp pilus assembly protein CpaB [Sphingomonadaceae bacterium]